MSHESDVGDTGAWRNRTTKELAEAKLLSQKLQAAVTVMEGQHVELNKTLVLSAAAIAANSDQINSVRAALDKLIIDLKGIIKMSNSIDGTIDLGARLGGFSTWCMKIAVCGTLIWAMFKYLIMEAAKK